MTDKAMYQAWQAWHADLDPEDTPQVNPSFRRGWQAGQAAIRAAVSEPKACKWPACKSDFADDVVREIVGNPVKGAKP